MVEPSNNGPLNSGKLKNDSFIPWFSTFISKNVSNFCKDKYLNLCSGKICYFEVVQ